ncbi:MAG: hydrogenase nickel incorporation protein HypB [Deltaproteobacteria bacterium]|nr:hydrogenase nickel incorporation protein HypB [Deltaproteobacteria bacterium]
MCEACGCGDKNVVPIEVQTSLLATNDKQAQHNREHFLEHMVLALNLMGSPGSGKTALLEATARNNQANLRIGAVSADLATDNDQKRLEASGILAKSITTGSACHLDAALVHHALHDFAWQQFDIFFIENVGNLVCPAIYDLGQAANVVTLSVTEGEDKPYKYPVMFRKADLVVLTKIDLLPHVDVRVEAIQEALKKIMPQPRLICLSARTGEGMSEWLAWLDKQLQHRL